MRIFDVADSADRPSPAPPTRLQENAYDHTITRPGDSTRAPDWLPPVEFVNDETRTDVKPTAQSETSQDVPSRTESTDASNVTGDNPAETDPRDSLLDGLAEQFEEDAQDWGLLRALFQNATNFDDKPSQDAFAAYLANISPDQVLERVHELQLKLHELNFGKGMFDSFFSLDVEIKDGKLETVSFTYRNLLGPLLEWGPFGAKYSTELYDASKQ
jgi:hypothetical protein